MNLILSDFLNTDFRQAHNIIARYRAPKIHHKGSQAFTDFHDGLFPTITFLQYLVDAIFNENLLQTGQHPAFLQLMQTHLELTAECFARKVNIMLQDFAHSHEHRFTVHNDHGTR